MWKSTRMQKKKKNKGSSSDSNKFVKKNSKKSSKKKKNYVKTKGRRYDVDRSKITKVKISYLPHDISYREIKHLIQDDEWGKIGNIKIITYENERDNSITTVSYIDFYNENEADYFVKAINGTKNIDPDYPIFLEVRKLDK